MMIIMKDNYVERLVKTLIDKFKKWNKRVPFLFLFIHLLDQLNEF